MFDLQRLNFSQIADAQPQRFKKVDLAAARIVDKEGPQFVVDRTESEESHVCELVESLSHAWGYCGCDGFKFNDGPCSHLCAVWRAESEGLVQLPTGRPTAISVEVHDAQTEIAQAEQNQRLATDGGNK